MAHSRTWATYEAKPSGSDNANQGDDEIRATKVDIRERMAIDHEWNVSTAADGRHLKVTLKGGADAVAVAAYGIVYVKEVGGIPELFFIDDESNIVQLTSAGKINKAAIDANLDDLSDVSAAAPALRDSIYFDTADSTWKAGNPHAVYA